MEIIIADDCSSDGTTHIVQEFAAKHPEHIRLIVRDKNVGPALNFLELIQAARGKYTAYLEGDDYWTDQNKLQQQVDFLEANPDFSLCYHDVIFRIGSKKRRGLNWDAPEESDLRYLLRKGCYITSLSIVYRNDPAIICFMEDVVEAPMGDYLLFVAAAELGKLKRLKKPMGVYRIHKGGTWTQLGFKTVFDKVLLTFEALYDKLGCKYHDDLCINLLGNLEAGLREMGSETIKNNTELRRLLTKMNIPVYILEYLVFSAEEKGKIGYYSRNIPFALLLGGLKEKIRNNIPRF